jgi:hypothetical protein
LDWQTGLKDAGRVLARNGVHHELETYKLKAAADRLREDFYLMSLRNTRAGVRDLKCAAT